MGKPACDHLGAVGAIGPWAPVVVLVVDKLAKVPGLVPSSMQRREERTRVEDVGGVLIHAVMPGSRAFAHNVVVHVSAGQELGPRWAANGRIDKELRQAGAGVGNQPARLRDGRLAAQPAVLAVVEMPNSESVYE